MVQIHLTASSQALHRCLQASPDLDRGRSHINRELREPEPLGAPVALPLYEQGSAPDREVRSRSSGHLAGFDPYARLDLPLAASLLAADVHRDIRIAGLVHWCQARGQDPGHLAQVRVRDPLAV